MKNYERINDLYPPGMARLLCHLQTECKNCPVVKEHGKPDPVVKKCQSKLVEWLCKEGDREFWKGVSSG